MKSASLQTNTEDGKQDFMLRNGAELDYPATPPAFNRLVRCVVVDDEPHSLKLISRYIGDTPFLQLVHATTEPLELLEWALRERFDLLFLDVEMPRLSGFELVNLLRGKCHFILCSGHPKYALQGYDFDVCDYLLKPITYSRFIKAAGKAVMQMGLQKLPNETDAQNGQRDYLLLKGDRKHCHFRICLDEIEFMEAAGHYIHLYLGGEKKTLLLSMKQMMLQLPENRFVRVHHSYIVPINRITFVDFETLGLKSVRRSIPVSDTYRAGLLQKIKNFG
jgi:two-component system, LytTR family, response regulator